MNLRISQPQEAMEDLMIASTHSVAKNPAFPLEKISKGTVEEAGNEAEVEASFSFQ